MPLTPCPDCGNQCSLIAVACPKCGRPLRTDNLQEPAQVNLPTTEHYQGVASHGKHVTPENESTTQVEASETLPETESIEEKKENAYVFRCVRCGKQMPASLVCPKCGTGMYHTASPRLGTPTLQLTRDATIYSHMKTWLPLIAVFCLVFVGVILTWNAFVTDPRDRFEVSEIFSSDSTNTPGYSDSSDSDSYSAPSSPAYNSNYQRTRPDYDANAPLLPRHKGDIEPVYNEVQRLKKERGMTDAEAVNKILRDAGEIP